MDAYRELQERLKFQFTHPGGVRPGHTWREIVRREFQFTHPGGVRLQERRL